jgi:hypothetical protein
MLQRPSPQVRCVTTRCQHHWSQNDCGPRSHELRDGERLSRISSKTSCEPERMQQRWCTMWIRTTITELERNKNVRTSSVIVT